MPDTVISVGGDVRDIESKFKSVEGGLNSLAAKARNVSASTGPGLFSGLGGGITGGLSGVLGGLGIGLGVAGVVAGIKGLNDNLVETYNLSKRLDTSTGSIQRVGFIARQGGQDVESTVSSLVRLNRALAGAEKDPALATAFRKLGIDVESFVRLAPEQQIVNLAAALQGAESRGSGTTEMFALLSKKAEGLLPILNQDVAKLRELSERPVVSDRDIAAAKRGAEIWASIAESVTTALPAMLSGLKDLGTAAITPGSFTDNARKLYDQHAKADGDSAAEAQKKRDQRAEHDAQEGRLADLTRLMGEEEKLDDMRRQAGREHVQDETKENTPGAALHAIQAEIEAERKAYALRHQLREDQIKQAKALGEDVRPLSLAQSQDKSQHDAVIHGLEDQKEAVLLKAKQLAVEDAALQIQLRVNSLKAASHGHDTDEIDALNDSLEKMRVKLELQEKFKELKQDEAKAERVAAAIVDSKRAATNAQRDFARSTSAQDEADDIQARHAAGHGNTREAERFEQAKDLRHRVERLHNDTGLSYQDANEVGQFEQDDEDRQKHPGRIRNNRGNQSLAERRKHALELLDKVPGAGHQAQGQPAPHQGKTGAHTTTNDQAGADSKAIIALLQKIAVNLEILN